MTNLVSYLLYAINYGCSDNLEFIRNNSPVGSQ